MSIRKIIIPELPPLPNVKVLITDKNIENVINEGKIKCEKCEKYYTKKTLTKNGGICGRCIKKVDDNEKSEKNDNSKIVYISNEGKEKCEKCEKYYTKNTLKKYGGICGRCNNKKIGSIDKIIKKKEKCIICNKEFTKATLRKYKGMCGKCNNVN